MKFLICALFVLLTTPADAQPLPAWRTSLEKAIQLRDSGSEDAQARFLQAAAEAKEVADGGIALAEVWLNQAIERQLGDHHQEAVALLRRALAVYDGNPQAPPLELAATLHNLGISYRGLARWQEAESHHRRSIEVIERTGGPRHPALVSAFSFLGLLYVELYRANEAEPLFVRALKLGSEVFGQNHPNLVPGLTGLTIVRRLRGDLAAARQSAVRALRIAEGAHGPESLVVANTLHELGRLDFEAGRLRDASASWQRALEIVQKTRAPANRDILVAIVQLADIARLERRYANAEEMYLRAQRGAEQAGAGDLLGFCLHHLACLYADRDQHDRAELLLRRSLSTTEKEFGARNVEWGMCATNLARSLLALKKPVEAEEWARSAVAAFEQANGVRHPFFLQTLEAHARILRTLKRKDEARQVSNRAQSLAASGERDLSGHTIGFSELRIGK